MKSVKIYFVFYFKAFRAENFALRNFCCFFLHYIHMLKSLFCEDISAEYEFKSAKFKGGIDRLKIK